MPVENSRVRILVPADRFTFKKQEVLGRTNRLVSFDTTRTAWKTTRPTVLILLRMYLLLRQRFYRAVS
jgi:hypothetical protein